MLSWHLEGTGSIEHLVCREHEVPVPGPREVLVRVHASALNARDHALVLGTYPLKPRAGLVPLSDGAGEVAAIGSGVTRFAVGDRVAAIFHQGWLAGRRTPELPRADLGGTLDGMLAEYVVLDEQGLVRIPAALSFAEAATLPTAAVTAWSALTAHGPLLPGQVVLVQGTGGVAVFALQLARLAGARVIALTSSAAKVGRLRALGAEIVVDTAVHPDWHKAVLKHTDGRGVDLVVEVVGEFDKTFRATRIGGAISFVGRLGDAAATASLLPVQMRNLRLAGIGVGSRADFESLLRAVEAHGLRPLVDRRFRFADARAAYEAFGARQFVGKIVIEHGAARSAV